MKGFIKQISEKLTRKLQQGCSSLPPKIRLLIVGSMTAIFTIIALYLFITSIFFYDTNIDSNKQLSKLLRKDSINLNINQYGR